MELEPGPEEAPKVAHAQGLSVLFAKTCRHAQQILPYAVVCRLMLAHDAVFEFVQSHSYISPNAGGGGRNPLLRASKS